MLIMNLESILILNSWRLSVSLTRLCFSFFLPECPSCRAGSLLEGAPLRVGWFQRWCLFCCITKSRLICLSRDETYKVYWESNYHASWPHNRTWRGMFSNASCCLCTLFFLQWTLAGICSNNQGYFILPTWSKQRICFILLLLGENPIICSPILPIL